MHLSGDSLFSLSQYSLMDVMFVSSVNVTTTVGVDDDDDDDEGEVLHRRSEEGEPVFEGAQPTSQSAIKFPTHTMHSL